MGDIVEAIDDYHQTGPSFAVRMLKYGTYEVVMKRGIETPPTHISDFRSRDEAQAWIRENASGWLRSVPHRR